MADASESTIQDCPTCGALIDTVEEEPLALIHCPTCGAAMRVRRMYDQFELVEVLGAGGMGAVYRAHDTKLNRSVALKVLRTEHVDNPELIDSLTKEAAITASINHPHVVKVYTTGTSHGVFYIAMELVDKGSLDDLMGLQGKVGELQVLEVGIQVAQGLNAALQRGLIHRDVKPGNILFANAHTAKITDFGLAILQEQAAQGTGEVWGTPYYVAPEKLDNPPQEDFRSDLYSLGATLFHALCGRPPFDAETASMVALKHLKSQVVSIQSFAPEISSATAYVINKALSKDPGQRYPSYEEFIKSLQYAHDELVVAARNPQQKRRLVVGGESEQAMSWVTFAMVAIIVLTGVATFIYRDQLFSRSGAAFTPPPGSTRGPGAEPPGVTIDMEFASARQLLAAGKFSDAAASFRRLEARETTPQPLRNWITLHGALAFFLANQPDDARAELLKVEDRGLYSPDAMERPLAGFLVDTARLARQEESQPASLAANYNPATHESFALLLFAVKDWMQGAIDEAGPLFRQFLSANPPEQYAWINQLKPIAETFLADYTTWQPAAEAARAADTPAKQQQALEALRFARGQLKQRGKLVESFEREESRLEKLLRMEEERQQQRMAEDEAADVRELAALRTGIENLHTSYRFAEARRIAGLATARTDKGKAALSVWVDYTTGLAQFKATLINDINTRGYSQPVAKRNGTSLPAGKLRASEQQLEVVGFGVVAAPWAEVAPNSVMAIAAHFLRAEPGPDRQWQLGLFLLQANLRPQGLTLLQQAAQTRPDLQALLPGFQQIFGAE